MFSPQKVLIPGIIFGCGILILTAHFFASTQPAAAATPEASTPKSETTAASAPSCSHLLPEKISPWCSLIQESAQKYGVPAQLIAAVMLQESGGQAQVISSSGAVGLMQVMPSDGIAAGFICGNGPCFASRPTTRQLLDPAFNIDYGTRMLANLINKYGSLREALRAYGPFDVGYYYADKVLAIQGNL